MTGQQRFGSIVVLTNITERKLAEETLRHTEKLAATGRLAHCRSGLSGYGAVCAGAVCDPTGSQAH
jgi:hypothetical protein